ncbi:MAG: MYXO-CTERM sorting domain-containing protein, partial [Bradymonadaceae bacterium]
TRFTTGLLFANMLLIVLTIGCNGGAQIEGDTDGGAESDTGTQSVDTHSEDDAGATADAGPDADAGASPSEDANLGDGGPADGSSPGPDASTKTDGADRPSGRGCGCHSTPSDSPGGLPFLAFVVIVGAWRRP